MSPPGCSKQRNINGSGIHTLENIVVAYVKIILLQNPDQKIMMIDKKFNNYTR